MTSFSDLLQLHRQLDDLFLKHQRALLRLNLQRASETFDQYERELLSHIRDEEALMIPLSVNVRLRRWAVWWTSS
jgi:hypothetical protein